MAWVVRSLNLLIVSPNLISTLPFVYNKNNKLTIVNSRKKVCQLFTSYDEWEELVKKWGYSVHSFEEISNLTGNLLVEVYPNNFIVEDGTSKVFTSLSSYCKYKDIARDRLYKDLSSGSTFENVFSNIEGYIKSPRYSSNSYVYDHLGNSFDNFYSMEQYYGLSRGLALTRIKSGWSLEKALTTPTSTYSVKDHLGREFSSQRDMAKYYGLSVTTLRRRLERGMSLKESLTSLKRDC